MRKLLLLAALCGFFVSASADQTCLDGACYVIVANPSAIGGGTQYTDQDTFTNATNIGNQVMGSYQSTPDVCEDNSLCAIGINSDRSVKVNDSGGSITVDLTQALGTNLGAVSLESPNGDSVINDTADTVKATLYNSSGVELSYTANTDDADFTDGTTASSLVGGVAEAASPTAVTEGDVGAFAMTLNRAIKSTPYTSGGTEIAAGTASAAVTMNTATTTEIVALTASQKIYITGGALFSSGTNTVTLKYGTGTNCGTGTTSISGAMDFTAQTGIGFNTGQGASLVIPAGNAFCITTSAAVQLSGWVTYVKF